MIFLKLGVKPVVAALLGGAAILSLSGCGSSSSSSSSAESGSADTAVSDEAPLAQADPVPDAPTHNYIEHVGNIYYYPRQISKEDAERGQAASSVMGFRYIGKNGAGENMVSLVDSRGLQQGMLWCADPCRIIRSSDGATMLYNNQSVGGAVFEDVMNGQLEPLTPIRPTTQTPSAPAAPTGDQSVEPNEGDGAQPS